MRRGSGILIHITSLPSPYGIGDLGPEAYAFVDFLSETKQSFWQILPLNPIDHSYGSSPYHSVSAFAGNILLISPDVMMQDGLLTKGDVEPIPNFPEEHVDYKAVFSYKKKLFSLAFERFKKKRHDGEYEQFLAEHSQWLEDLAFFYALKNHFHRKQWSSWPHEIRDRRPEALESLKSQLADRIEFEKFLQYTFFKQWFLLKTYCNQKNIQIIGDIPIYVEYDSVDLWVNPGIFKLDEEKRPYVVAGVPPDYFSETGQLWGNPVYHWEVLRERGYDWWISRIAHNLKLFNVVRIDHFRGLVAFWEVRAGERTAINGQWVEVPTEDFFNTLLKRFFSLPVIAEDLGLITPDVREVMWRFGLPGMKVLLFAFGEDHPLHPYLPHTYVNDYVVYTGTHDNNTVKGWFENESTPDDRRRLFRYLGREVTIQDVHWEFIRLAMMSVANIAIIPMQDVLCLGEEARMNQPTTIMGNWEWRFAPYRMTSSIKKKLEEMTMVYGRA